MPHPPSLPYPPQNINFSQESRATQATALYLPQSPSENVNPNLSSMSNVVQPSAPYPASKTLEETDSPPNFAEAMKMCPKK
jgi:hypothetical protein